MTEDMNSTQMDDSNVGSETEAEMFAQVMKNSPFAKEAGIEIPVSEVEEEVPVDESEEDLEQDSEAAEEDAVESDEESGTEKDGEEKDASEDATLPETYALDDLEDIMVTHKIDGEEVTRPLSEWIAGSATQQHLSKQGRELGESRKAFEEERAKAVEQLEIAGAAFASTMLSTENHWQSEYQTTAKKLAQARKEGDKYTVGELTEELEVAQKNYWGARNKREAELKRVQEIKQQSFQSEFEKQVKTFYSKVPELIPDWNEEVQNDIRSFALAEGIPEALLSQITDPAIVKFVDDYRRLKKGVSVGAKKREAAPKKKAPLKRGISESERDSNKAKMEKARAFRADATPDDQMDFLRNYARNSLSNL